MLRRILFLLVIIAITAWYQTPISSFASEGEPNHSHDRQTDIKGVTDKMNISWLLSTEISVPMTGSVGVTLGKPISERITISNFLYYFDRDWMILLEKGDWHSNSVYIGLSFSYFPFAKPRQYEGYFIGGDFGLAISKQEFKPLRKSDVFFFPFLDIYFIGYVFPIWRGLDLTCLFGGGWADVESQVVIDGHRNTGDYYPLVNTRFSYKW
jgi:hypothetical protein